MKKIKILITIIGTLVSIFASGQLNKGGVPKSFSQVNFKEGLEKVKIIEMPKFDIQQEIDKNKDKLPLVFAKTFSANIDIRAIGTNYQFENGSIWRIGLRSEKAYSINVVFSEFNLSEGSSLFIYNHDTSKILGAFTIENNPYGDIKSLACMPVNGDLIYLELFIPNGQESKCVSS